MKPHHLAGEGGVLAPQILSIDNEGQVMQPYI